MSRQTKIKALGIMNGTSVDAIDYSLIEITAKDFKPRFVAHVQKKIPAPLRKKILLAASNQLTTYDLSHLNFDLGRLYGRHVKDLQKKWRWDVLGLHGQTVHHEGRKATLQIGTPVFIQNISNKPVVSDFRSPDVAQGGEGAPFAPFFQKYIVGDHKQPIAFQNLGGIANLTWIHKNKVAAFDSGPANILLDAWINKASKGKKSFDRGGQTAAKGLYDPHVLKRFLQHPYFKKKPPKSCGREEFDLRFIEKHGGTSFKKLSFNDQMATLCELSAVTIADGYKKYLKQTPKTIFCYGGGIYNDYLMHRIRFHLEESEVTLTDDLGWPAQAFEGALIAFLAAARWQQKKVHLPRVTGADKFQNLGQMI